jgi:hypothetical protein
MAIGNPWDLYNNSPLRMSEAEYRAREREQQMLGMAGLAAAIGGMGHSQMTNPAPKVTKPTEPEFNLVLLTGDDDEA